MIRVYAGLVLIAVVALLGWHYSSLIDDNRRLTQEAERSQSIIAKERQSAQEAANRALALSIEESRNEEEYNRRTKCIADKSCGYVLRYKACPAVPSSSADQSQSAEAAAESERQFQRWANHHQYVIEQWESRVKALESELNARSAPDYCEPK